MTGSVYADIVDTRPGDGPRTPPRSHLATNATNIDLTGRWAFRILRGADELVDLGGDAALAAPNASLEDWEQIDLPCHWVLAGENGPRADHPWGAPAYTNVQFPFPVDPPHVPAENPTGLHRRTVEVPEELFAEGSQILLRTLGIESLGVLFINGERVGAIRGSRLTQELDVTGYLQPGENTLYLRVHQFSAHSYLEDQDQWWLPGIFRQLSLEHRPAGRIDDVWLRADMDPATGEGTLVPEVRAPRTAWPITIRVPELGIDQVFTGPEELAPIPVGPVEAWSADRPRLYSAEACSSGETVRVRVGFRRVEIVGHEWRVNGKKLRLRGMNRHDFHPVSGRVFDEADTWEQLCLMKRHGINAVRTSHYPPHPRLLEMTDELGLWVIDECDLETHGFELVGWEANPADDPQWREALVDRAQRFVERDKNHPSVICWSLGNESHTGRNVEAMAAWIRRRDPERPIHYEPDFDGRYTDVVSRMYEPIESMREMSAGHGQGLATSAGRNAVLAGRPMILCEYAHAMGNGPGLLTEYEEAFSTLPQWHGGFVWEWRDHGLRTRAADGSWFSGYGGDFGEPLHDGSFVCDGLVLSDGTPTPALGELKAVVSPIQLELVGADDAAPGAGGNLADAVADVPAGLRLRVRNLRHDGDTSDVRFFVSREADGRERATVEVEVPAVPAGSETLVELPAEAVVVRSLDEGPWRELWLTVRAVLAADTAWADAGHELAFAQRCLAEREAGAGMTSRYVAAGGSAAASTGLTGPTGAAAGVDGAAPAASTGPIRVGEALFEARTGTLLSINGLDVRGPRFTLWRAPIENDVLTTFGSYLEVTPEATRGLGAPGPSTAETWRSQHLHLLQRRTLEVTVLGEDALCVRELWTPAARRNSVEVQLLWRWQDGGLHLAADALPSLGWSGTWPRIGLAFELAPGVGPIEWFGTGPAENYADSRHAARVGRFTADVADLTCTYAVPQESGHRSDLRELVIQGADGSTADKALMLTASPVAGRLPGFSLRAHDEHEVTAAGHPHELPASRATHLFLDAAQHGLGSRSCGPDVLPAHHLRPQSAAWSVRFTVLSPS